MKTYDFRGRPMNSASPSSDFPGTYLAVLSELPQGQDETTADNLHCSESQKEPTVTNNLTVES